MKKALKKMAVGMLVISMLVSGALTTNISTALAADEPEKQSVVVSGCITTSPFMSEIQYQKFMSYLTQEYAPEIKADWDKAFVERKSIQPELSLQIKQGTITSNQDIEITYSSTVADGDLKLVPGSSEDIKQMLDNTATPTTSKIQTFAVNGTGNDQNESEVISIGVTGTPETDENLVAQLNLQNELDQAITSNDSKAINTVLGKMLTNYTQITEEIKNNLSKVAITDK